jgi:hypothetical protein
VGSGHSSPWRKEKAVGQRSQPANSGGCRLGDAAHGSRGRKGGGPVGVGHDWAIAVGRSKGIVTFLLYSNSFQHN